MMHALCVCCGQRLGPLQISPGTWARPTPVPHVGVFYRETSGPVLGITRAFTAMRWRSPIYDGLQHLGMDARAAGI